MTDHTDLPQSWITEFGSTYFDKVDKGVMDALALLDDLSWAQNDLPEFELCSTEVGDDKYTLRAWVGFDEEDDDKEVFVFSLGLSVNDEYQWVHTEAVESMFSIDPMCRFDSEDTEKNNTAIIELIKSTRNEFPSLVLDYIKRL